ncbi:hypothetical protein [Herbaspirillum huttiense]|uniref:Uncharacterized protein n=1 Tax=Herbaspirillum huttiense subsp. lycopersici TaxID=3074428 RepID=A0ABU2EG32_9BURK|nr:hypothetical protein [Herbaspirillum huttiense]MDR9847090.1 hypothetical protein [Herbaspirillum huttiense SE1]
MKHILGRVGIQVTRYEGYPDLGYRMFWCKRKDFETNEWLRQIIYSLNYHGGMPGDDRMKVGESRRYWVWISVKCHQDRWGEWEDTVEFMKIKRAK